MVLGGFDLLPAPQWLIAASIARVANIAQYCSKLLWCLIYPHVISFNTIVSLIIRDVQDLSTYRSNSPVSNAVFPSKSRSKGSAVWYLQALSNLVNKPRPTRMIGFDRRLTNQYLDLKSFLFTFPVLRMEDKSLAQLFRRLRRSWRRSPDDAVQVGKLAEHP